MSSDDELWGMNLYTTGRLIGWLCLVVSIIQGLYIIYFIYDAPKMAQRAVAEGRVKGDKREAEDTITAVATVTLCIYLFFVVIDGLSAILLLIGINKETSVYLLPWLINNAITITSRLCCSVCLFIFCAVSAETTNETTLFIFFHTISTVICIWMWIFILELYRNISSDE